MQAFVVIQMKDELAKNSELSGLFKGGIEEIVHRGGGNGPSRVKHKEDSNKGSDGVQVPAPYFVTKQVGDKER